MSAFNTPFQRGQGLSNQGIPSPSQFRPTPDSAVADAVGRAGVSIAQQAIRNQREEERQKQLEEQQEQRLAVRRATAEAQEAKAALGRQLSEGQITHDQYFAESSSLLDNTKGAFEDLAKTYPDAQAVMDIASLEVANSLNNTTSGIRVKYLEDQAYQNAVEDIEQLSEGMQVFRPDPQSGESIFFIEPTVERLAMIRSQIDADTALSARDKNTLIASLEQQSVFTAINQLRASGKMTPEAISEIKRMTENEVLLRTVDKIRDDLVETQDADKQASDTRDYNLLEQSEFAAFQQAPTPDLVTMFNNLTSSLSGLDVDVSQEDIVQKTLRAAETRLASGEFGDVVGQGGTLSSEQVNELATMEAQVENLLEVTAYTKTKDGITLLNQIKSLRKQNVENKKAGQSLASTAPTTDLFKPDDPGRAAAIKASIDDGSYLTRMIGNYNNLGRTEPEYINHIEDLASKGNYTAVIEFARGLTETRRSEFASSQGLSSRAGLVIRLSTRASDDGPAGKSYRQVLDNPLALARAYDAVEEQIGYRDNAVESADLAAVTTVNRKGELLDRPVGDITEPLRFGQRFDQSVIGALSFEDIDGNTMPLTLPGFEVIEPFFLEQVAVQSALVSLENPDFGSQAVTRVALGRARQATQERFTFVTQSVSRFDRSGDAKREEVMIPYDNKALPPGLSIEQLLTQADKALRGVNEFFDEDAREPVDEESLGLAARLDLEDIHSIERNGEQKLVVPYVSMVDDRVLGYYTIDSDDVGAVEPTGILGLGGDEPIQGTNLKTDQYDDLMDDGWQKSSISPGEPTAMLGDSYDPTLLWNPELYDSPSVKLLHPVAQAKLMRHAQLVAGKTFPEASDATKMTIAMQMISDHGWKLS
jgi:hypothetical protein